MIHVPPDEPGDSPLTSRCAECRARLAADQRYCVECGVRRGPLPAPVAELLRETAPTETIDPPAGAPVGVPVGVLRELDDAPGGSVRDWLYGGAALSPRAAGVAVMSMLAFGAVVASSVGSVPLPASGAPLFLTVTLRTAHSHVVTAVPTAESEASAGTGAGAGGGGGGNSGAGAVTVTVPAQTAPTVTTPTPSGSSNSGGGSATPTTAPASTLPPVKHVFVIVLSNVGYTQSFGARSTDPYLARTLAGQGEVIPDYYAVAQGSLANSIAMISGQGPTEQTAADCPTYSDITPGKTAKYGEVAGSGCVYPLRTATLANQLTDNGETWKAYIEGVDGGAAGQPKACRHPVVGGVDADRAPLPGDPYVTWRNPFVYFHSLIDPSTCAGDDVGLRGLNIDLKSQRATPSVSWIFPGPCDDGDLQPCATGKPAGMAPADAFLKAIVPVIEHSAAYRADGLIAITADQAPQSGPNADPSACCGNPTYPNLSLTPTTTNPTTTTTSTTTTTPTTTTPATSGAPTTPTGGGGRVGLLLISKYIKPGSTDTLDYFNHFALLASVEDLFGLKHLGYAADPALPLFYGGVYNAYARGG